MSDDFVRSNYRPVEIAGLPVVHFRSTGLTPGDTHATWFYFPNEKERAAWGLRIEVYRTPSGRGEVRLVKGPPEAPKHLRVIRLNYLVTKHLQTAIDTLMIDFRQKGW